MAPYLRAKTRSVAAELEAWLEARPPATKRHYLAYAKSWSEFLRVKLGSKNSCRAWRNATCVAAQAWANKKAKAPAQHGRSRSSSPDGKVALSTVAHACMVLKSCYDELISRGVVENNPFIKITRELKKHRPGGRRPHLAIPGDKVKALTDWEPRTSEELRDLVLLKLLFVALRRSEVASLRLADVCTTPKGVVYLVLRKTKSQQVQKLALPDWAAADVVRLCSARVLEGAQQGDALLVRHEERRVVPLTGEYVYKVFRRHAERVGLGPEYSPHACRVTAITRLLDQGFSHREVIELSRHSSVQMVEKYDRKRVELDESVALKLKFK